MVEARAAPAMPILGMSNKFRGILTASETPAATVLISGFPRPVISLLNTLQILNATIPGRRIHRGLRAGRKAEPKNSMMIYLPKAASTMAAKIVIKKVLRHILGVDMFASSALIPGVRANITVPTAAGKYHNASAMATEIE